MNCAATVPFSTFMRLWAIYISPGSICLLRCRKYVDWSWEFINRSQTHECGSRDWGRAIPRKGINKWDLRCSAVPFDICIKPNNKYLLEGGPRWQWHHRSELSHAMWRRGARVWKCTSEYLHPSLLSGPLNHPNLGVFFKFYKHLGSSVFNSIVIICFMFYYNNKTDIYFSSDYPNQIRVILVVKPA